MLRFTVSLACEFAIAVLFPPKPPLTGAMNQIDDS